jgi:N-acetylglucosamine-6-sulfatase
LGTSDLGDLRASASRDETRRPNIVFILTDDQRWDYMGCMGHPFLKTPHLDRLAAEGALFINAFCTTSLCSPSRATFLTGTYAHVHGVINNRGREYNPEVTPSFPQILQAAGYRTAYIGKWHQAYHDEPRPGFDYWLSFVGQGSYFDQQLNENGRRFEKKGYITDILSDYAVQYIERNAEQPFCLILSHKAVHEPFLPPPRHAAAYAGESLPEPPNYRDDFAGKAAWQRRPVRDWTRYRSSEVRSGAVPDAVAAGPWEDPANWWHDRGRALNYTRCINSIDEGVGRIIAALEEHGVLDDTIIVFASDNGYFLGEHGRHDKRIAYDEAMRIAFVVRYPRTGLQGATIEGLALNLDLAPTLLDFTGVPIPGTMRGLSLRPLLEGKASTVRDDMFYEYWVELTHYIPRTLCVRTEDWKYIEYPDLDDIDELYDLKSDPAELHNLSQAPEHAEKKREMKARLQRLLQETDYQAVPPNLTPGQPEPAAPEGVMLSYTFDQIEGNSVEDESGGGLHGEMEGVRIVSARGGRAASFDGKGGITVPISERPDPSEGPWIIEAWVKPERDGFICAQVGERSGGYGLFVESGIPGLAIRSASWIYSRTIVDGREDCLGKWTHLAAVIEESRARLYVNGTLADWAPTPIPLRWVSDKPFVIGGQGAAVVDEQLPQSAFVGEIGALRLSRGQEAASRLETPEQDPD